MKRYKIVNKKRFSIFIILLIVFLYFAIVLAASAVRAQYLIGSQNYIEYFTEDGDTLWNIALKYKPSKYDVRKMVYDIKQFNQIDTNYIYPGDLLKIPIE